MSWLDISTYVVQNCAGLIMIPILGAFVAVLCAGLSAEVLSDDSSCLPIVVFLSIFGFSILIGCITFIPTHDRLLHLKVSRIKDEAVNKENISKGVETLERISHKLECKYLGCKKQEVSQ